jgi:hypothetical protein
MDSESSFSKTSKGNVNGIVTGKSFIVATKHLDENFAPDRSGIQNPMVMRGLTNAFVSISLCAQCRHGLMSSQRHG